MKIISLIIGLSFLSLSSIAQKVYPVNSYGAIGDGVFNNTLSIQKAIDAAAAAGGGQVLVPDGYYMIGQLYLKTGVELHLSDKATLLGSTNRLDYTNKVALALISARDQQNVAITGKGTIDGRGRDLAVGLLKLLTEGKVDDPQWKIKRPTEANRPMILSFYNCTGVKVTGIHIKDAACWVQSYNTCTNVLIDDIHVESMAYWNNDGIDIVDSHNVKISNSDINAADDAICLKSENANKSCENVEVLNCTVRSSASGFKLGTGSMGAFRKIKVKNLTVYNTYRSAIALETVDGAAIEDVDIRDVNVKNSGNAIFIRLGHRNTDSRYSTINRVYIANVKAEVPAGKPDIGYPLEGPLPKVGPHNLVPASITGIPGHPVQGVTLENIDISYGGGAARQIAEITMNQLPAVTENVPGYPEFTMFGELPAWGLYTRHAENISLKNVKLSLKADDFRPALVFDDVSGLTLNGLSAPATGQVAAVVLNKVIRPVIQQLSVPGDQNKAILIQ